VSYYRIYMLDHDHQMITGPDAGCRDDKADFARAATTLARTRTRKYGMAHGAWGASRAFRLSCIRPCALSHRRPTTVPNARQKSPAIGVTGLSLDRWD
jgi:hypothetical protein